MAHDHNDDDVNKIVHDLDHQKLEAIGVEELSNRTMEAAANLGQLLMKLPTRTQELAVLKFALRRLEPLSCDKCIDMSDRVATEMGRKMDEIDKKISGVSSISELLKALGFDMDDRD